MAPSHAVNVVFDDLFIERDVHNRRGSHSSSDSSEIIELGEALMVEVGAATSDVESSRQSGSVIGRIKSLNRERESGHENIMRDYFGPSPIYTSAIFRTRFRIRKSLFLRISAAVEQDDPWFTQRYDAAGVPGFTPLQKSVAAIRQLAYGNSADLLDEYLRMSVDTSTACLHRFCKSIVNLFGEEYLRSPTAEDTKRILEVNAARGFPGMLGSLDCTHWRWKNCPVAWAGQHTGKDKKASVILEAVATYDTWIWHAFFGLSGSNNDLNALDHSHLLRNAAEGNAPPVNFSVNGREYTTGYHLTDGIYRPWPCLVQALPVPVTEKEKYFNSKQEAVRKDVERAFGVLKARWAILANPARQWQCQSLNNIMIACIILHNMIVEDERDAVLPAAPSMSSEHTAQYEPVPSTNREETFLQRYCALRDESHGRALRTDLVEHIWQQKGSRPI